MKKERIKDVVLIALVICSLLLTGKIWLNEKLWPDGYNFFTLVQNKFTALFSQERSDDARNPLFPSHMIAYTVKNSDHASFAVTKSNEHYDTINEFCELSVADALSQSQKSISTVDESAWKDALFTNGMYIDYGSGIPSDVFCALFGGSEQAEITDVTNEIRYVIITAEGNLVGDIVVYVRDTADNCFKIQTKRPKKELTDILNSLNDYVTPTNRFSFFIGADTATSGMGEVLFNSYLLLTETETELSGIVSENPLYAESENDIEQAQLERLLRCFSMNPKTARKYTDAEENIIFLQNQSTLKISKNGQVEYTAAAGRNGFMLSESQSSSSAELARAAVSLVYDVFEIFSDASTQLYMSDFITQETQTVVNLDYNINGTKVITDLAGGHAANVQIEDGCVQKFSLLLRSYEVLPYNTKLSSTYTAVDEMFTNIDTNKENTMVESMFIGYFEDGSIGEKLPRWFMKLEGENELKIQE